jgi:hypothetical protein
VTNTAPQKPGYDVYRTRSLRCIVI